MAFRHPSTLVPITFTYNGAVDDLTDVVLGYIHMDCKIMYLDVAVHDANHTFDTTTLTFEYDTSSDGSTWGTDTQIDTFATGAATGTPIRLQKTLDDLTNSEISLSNPEYGARVLLTAANVGTGADLGLTLILWVWPRDEN